MKQKAFTLIELLVVIAIIALLLSITMPGLQKAKQHAERLICKTNLHNYGLAGNLYLNDNDQRFPDPWQSLYDSCQGRCTGTCTNSSHQAFPGETQRYCRWHNADYSLAGHPEYAGPFWAYLQSEEVNLCPVFRKVAAKRGSEHPGHDASIPINPQFGYSQNAYLGTSFFGGVLKVSDVRSPARTFYFAEENMWVLNQSVGYRENLSKAVLNDTALLARVQPDNATGYDDAFATFHSPPGGDYNEGAGNAVMLDGSVETVTPHDQGTFKKAWPRTGMAL
jgi:prepilin-type N-terminal cleavage/methylation domain-containing protein